MPDARWNDPREYDDRNRGDGRPRVYGERGRNDRDPRDSLIHDLDLPRGEERELVVDRDRVYELNGEDSRALAAVGTFGVVPEQDLNTEHETLRHLRDGGLVETVDLGGDERGLTLTKEGRDLLDSHSLERDGGTQQAFHAGVSRPREIEHDSNLYATFCQEEARLRDAGARDPPRHPGAGPQTRVPGVPAGTQLAPIGQRRTTRPERRRDPRLGARARPAVLRWPGAFPGLPVRVRGRWPRAPRGRRAVHAALPRRSCGQPREDRLPDLRRRVTR